MPGRDAKRIIGISLLAVLGIAPPAGAGQTETQVPGVVADGDRSSEPTRDPGRTSGRRTVHALIRDPWSVGVRVLWRSLGGAGGGGGLPPTAGGSPPAVLGSCLAVGSCLPNGLRHTGSAPGIATTGNGLPVQGVAFDAGRLITSRVEVGVGLDLTTHPGDALLSTAPGVAFRSAPGDAAAQTLAGERSLQLDLAARLTYRARGNDPAGRGASLVRPYVGIGAGVSRYFAGFSTVADNGAWHRAAFDPWIPNFQIYGGFLVPFARRAPMLDVDIRYLRAATHGLDLGGVRFGIGVRYPF